MAINHKKYYNANAGKNTGRDSLGKKEGTQQCNIPSTLELLKLYRQSKHKLEIMEKAISLLGTKQSPLEQPGPQGKAAGR